MHLGIMGGTFDPIHVGHLTIAEEARCRVPLDEVLFLPTGRPWMKVGQDLSAGPNRLAMVQRAIASNPHFRVSPMELERAGDTHTVDTLEALRRERGPEAEFFFILGLDSVMHFPRWREPRRILELCRLVVVTRPEHSAYDPHVLEAIRPAATERVVRLDGPQIGVSGTDIRRRVSRGLSIKYLVPEAVEEYIYQQGLYRSEERARE